ncbi:MAG: hybrid sensor histidine kinase/response regulator, partial [Caldilineae bacterium]
AGSVRVATAKLDALFLQAEEMLAVKLTLAQRAAELRDLLKNLELEHKDWEKLQKILPPLRRAIAAGSPDAPISLTHRQLADLLHFLDLSHTRQTALTNALETLTRHLGHDQQSLGSKVDTLLDDMKQVLMLPFGQLLRIFPRMVRDMARAQNKEVELVIQGEEVEIDRRILEGLKDPLIHLVRNSVDHGLEPPDERQQAGKPRRGTVTLAVSQQSASKIELLVADDGGGIDVERVKAAAVREGHLTPSEAEALSEADALALIFRSAVSTSPIVTELSGRGLGLAIVRERIEAMGGRVFVSTARHIGTTFQIILPVTLSTFRGILVACGGRQFVIPTLNVERVLRFRRSQLKRVENRDTLTVNGDVLSVVSLAGVLGLPPAPNGDRPAEFVPALILSGGGRRIVFTVDAIIREQEVLVKGLGRQLARVRNIAGATILGDGQAVPILHPADLLKSAVEVTTTTTPSYAGAPESAPETAERPPASILVVEDSITSRTLLTNVLEAAGYRVKTAVDGVDAYTTLKTEPFDLIVSDIQMPRMDGFELTAKVRADPQLGHLPVVLVTSLSAPEDRERGIEVGADAYIMKSSFDQANLLEIVKRLIQ